MSLMRGRQSIGKEPVGSWTTAEEIRYLNNIGTYAKTEYKGAPKHTPSIAQKIELLEGTLVGYSKRSDKKWGSIDPEKVINHAKSLLRQYQLLN